MEISSKPLDALNKSRGKRVIVDLNNGWRYAGSLNAFDMHINIVLDDAEEYEPKTKRITKKIDESTSEETVVSEKVLKAKIGTVFIRGGTVKHISVQ